jgi:hypothetical protein
MIYLRRLFDQVIPGSMSQINKTTIDYDLCVIGSGPAGIIVVLEYMKLNPHKTIALVEYGRSGQAKTNNLDDSITITNPVNHHQPYECTNKGLGGTSLTWGGRCVMYDDIDFINRPIIGQNCTWDIDLFEEVKKYVPNAANYFECGDPIFDLNEINESKQMPIAEHFKQGIVSDNLVERWSVPTRFGKKYKKILKAHESLKLLEGYEAIHFSPPDHNGNVSTLTIRNVINNETLEVRSKQFVISAGTQETTRILLRNKHLFNHLNQVPSALGKYYQCHLFGKIASVIFSGDPKKTDYGFLVNNDGTYVRRRFQFTTDYLLKNDLLNTAMWLDNPPYHDPKHKNGAMSFMYLAMITPFLGKKLAPPAIAQSITNGKVKSVHKHFWNVVKDFPGSLKRPFLIFYKRYCIKRKLPGVFLYNPQNIYALYFHSEQLPCIENKMELSSDDKELVIHYKLNEEDINSIVRLHETIDKWLRECNCGKLQYWFQKEDLPEAIRNMSKDGIHQIGTTRISDSSENGVVDRNLKLWGTKNIFICSSSVFPTSGQANPTFFLGAFAVRLANYLNHQCELLN